MVAGAQDLIAIRDRRTRPLSGRLYRANRWTLLASSRVLRGGEKDTRSSPSGVIRAGSAKASSTGNMGAVSDSVLVVSSRALVLACERMNIDTEAMLQAVGVSRVTLDDPDARLALSQVQALWTQAYRLSGDPDLALHAAEQLPLGAYRVVDFLAMHAPTFGEGVRQVSAYFPLINSAVRLPIVVGEDEVVLGCESPNSPGALTRQYVEYTFAAVYLRNREVAGVDFSVKRVEFHHERPASTREHERIFACPVYFERPASAMVFDRSVWDTERSSFDSDLFSLLEEHAAILLERSPRQVGVVADARRAITAELRGGDPSVHRVAKTLGMSPRTLQRRLMEEQVKFTELLDEMRAGAARAYLSQADISISETAYVN